MRPHRRDAIADLFNAGCLGLIRAVDLFDPNVGTRFITYASWGIEQVG